VPPRMRTAASHPLKFRLYYRPNKSIFPLSSGYLHNWD
jgi:hypothetical protein